MSQNWPQFSNMASSFEELLRHRYAPGTRPSYSSALNSFNIFCAAYDLQPGPERYCDMVYQPVFCAWLMYLKEKPVIFETARKYFAAVKSQTQCLGVVLPFSDMPVLVALQKSWKRQENPPPLKIALSEAIIEAIADKYRYTEPMFVAAMIFAFRTLARISEVLALKWLSELNRPQHKAFRLTRAKTDPFGEEGQILALKEEEWTMVKELLPRSRRGQVFPLKRTPFMNWLKDAATNIAPNFMSNQVGKDISLRRSGAQSLYNAGHSLPMVREKGRWKGESWRRYIDTSTRVLV